MKRMLLCLVAALVAVAAAAPIEPLLVEQMAKLDAGERIEVMVVLTEQLDGENIIRTIKDKDTRWNYTVSSLKAMAERSQADLLADLRGRAASGDVANIIPLWLVNAVYCEATPEVVYALAARPEVWFVQWDNIVTEQALAVEPDVVDVDGSFTVEWNVKKVKADSVWLVHGYTGDGIVVGDIDTGCDYTHPDLADHMWTDPNYPNHGWDFENDDNDPRDSHGHGTHTCGTVAGDGTGGDTTGMAPNAQIMSTRTKTSISQPYPDTIAENTVINSMQFCVAPPLSPDNHADLLTMSLGWIIRSWSPRQAVWRAAVTNVAAAGLPYFIAAGNEGSGNTPLNLRCPGHAPDPWKHPADTTGGLSGSISIGATDNNDNIASFSSWGPVTWDTIDPYFDYHWPSGLLKPSFSAPGVNITSTRMGGGYTQMSGTSMATPCAAGVAALILEKNPNLLPEEVDEIMQNSVLPLGSQPKNNTFGTGRIDAMLCIENTPAPGPVHDVAATATNIGGEVRALRPFIPDITICNRGDFVEVGFQVSCRIDSSGTTIYAESLAVDSIAIGDTLHFSFPTWEVGPDDASYSARLFHNVGPDEKRRNDTIIQVTEASAGLIRIAIEMDENSLGRTSPNACYQLDTLCKAEGWFSAIVDGDQIDTYEELATYDVVVAGDVGVADNDFATYDDALLRWVHAGGGFVGTGWLVYGTYRGPGAGSPMDSVSPALCGDDYAFVSSEQVRITDNTHPITTAVGNFDVYDYSEYPVAGLRAGATMLGDYTSMPGTPSVAYQELGTGRSVYLGPIYFGDFSIHNNEPYFANSNSRRLLKQAILWAASGPGLAVEEPRVPVAERPRLTGARPNPMDRSVTISYAVPAGSLVGIGVYDLAGKLVRTLVAESGRTTWNRLDNQGRLVPSGVYFCRLVTGAGQDTRKLVVR